MKKLCLVALSITLAVVLACPALATSSEEEIAAEYLKEQGILEGDQNGDMNLASGLTRAQLAAVLTRLNGNQEHVQAEQEFYISQCKFPDVPAWARLYVGYCYFNSLMVGYDTGVFGADDGVTPAAACTVVLRYMDLPDIQWDYNTACQTALDRECSGHGAQIKSLTCSTPVRREHTAWRRGMSTRTASSSGRSTTSM